MIYPNSSIEKAKDETRDALDKDDGLVESLIEGDTEITEEAKLLDAAISQGIQSFDANLIFDHIIENYQNAEKIYGKKMLRYLSGYSADALKKNIKFPELLKEVKKRIKDRIESMEDEGLINEEGFIEEKGFDLAGLVLYMEELEELNSKGFGEWKKKEGSVLGDAVDVKQYKKGDRYRDIASKKSVRMAIRRNHSQVEFQDLRVVDREAKGKIYVVYALDASGSMRGEKISACKKAGIGLAFKAIGESDKVGLIVFGSEVEEFLYPTDDFGLFLRTISKIKAKQQTNIAATIEKAIEMFPSENVTKHLVLITDAMPTKGDNPEDLTLKGVDKAVNAGVTVSLIGVDLKDGEELAKKIVELGKGRLNIVQDLNDVDKVVISDYYSL